MNERVSDIAIDVMVKYINDADDWAFTSEELDKIGETIVLECAKIAYEADETNPYGAGVGQKIGDAIKKHFGVE